MNSKFNFNNQKNCAPFVIVGKNGTSYKLIDLGIPFIADAKKGTFWSKRRFLFLNFLFSRLFRIEFEKVNLARKLGGICDKDQLFILNSIDGPTTAQCGPLSGYASMLIVYSESHCTFLDS